MARIARTPGPAQVLVEAILESGHRPPTAGPLPRTTRPPVAATPGGPHAGCARMPGQTEPLHRVQEPMRQIQPRMRDSLHCHAMCGLEARCPAPYGGLGDGADGGACRALRAASTELEASVLRGLLAGALWTAARVCGHNMQATSSCPGCGSQHEDEAHVLWDCPSWEAARVAWRALVLQAAEQLQLGPPTRWPACLRRAGLLPLVPSVGADRRHVDEFLYRLYGMYLEVLTAHAHTPSRELGRPWQALCSPLPRPQCDSARASRRDGHGSRRSSMTWSAGQRPSVGTTVQGPSPGQIWPSTLRCSWADPCQRLRTISCEGTRLPLGERVQVLR